MKKVVFLVSHSFFFLLLFRVVVNEKSNILWASFFRVMGEVLWLGRRRFESHLGQERGGVRISSRVIVVFSDFFSLSHAAIYTMHLNWFWQHSRLPVAHSIRASDP